ncbi:MAG: HEAT repeat domain-containing protein [Planctomycetes bacterium]|nr:HEAT repeat domain-containing protein [Planctomycetota bacterium]
MALHRAVLAALLAIAAAPIRSQTDTTPNAAQVAAKLGAREPSARRAAVERLLTLRPDLRALQAELLEIVAERAAPVVRRLPRRVVFGGLRPAVGNDVPARRADLASVDADVRQRAIVALCALGDAAQPFEAEILARAADPDADVRAAVARLAGGIGFSDAVRAAVLAALRDESAVVRRAAAEGLARHSDSPAIAGALRAAIQDPDVDVRRHVLQSLAHAGAVDSATAAEIVSSLRDREPKVRTAALDAIGKLGLGGERAVHETIRCLDDPEDYKVVLAALGAVAGLGVAAEAALPRLHALAGDEREETRELALRALWHAAPPATRGALALCTVEALGDRSEKVRKRAARLLRAFADGRSPD